MPTSRTRQAQATRALLIEVAREVFTERGYTETSIDEIVQRAGVAKGSLYHHFASKDAVFEAVVQAVQGDAVARILAAAVAAGGDPLTAARAGLSAFLDACGEPEFRRVVIVDSVNVLRSRSAEAGEGPAELAVLRTVVGPVATQLGLPGGAGEALTYVALGGLYGAALSIARAEDRAAARAHAEAVLDLIIDGLRHAVRG